MTITLFDQIAEPTTDSTAPRPLLELLRDALVSCADLSPEQLHSCTEAGQAATFLAGLARSAVAARGGDPGTTLHDGPGVVVIRDLVHAVMLLELAAAGSHQSVDSPDLDGTCAAAAAAHATLLETIRSARELA